jgi:hypothetical protein
MSKAVIELPDRCSECCHFQPSEGQAPDYCWLFRQICHDEQPCELCLEARSAAASLPVLKNHTISFNAP